MMMKRRWSNGCYNLDSSLTTLRGRFSTEECHNSINKIANLQPALVPTKFLFSKKKKIKEINKYSNKNQPEVTRIIGGTSAAPMTSQLICIRAVNQLE